MHTDFYTKVVICRFNGLWPKTNALQQWIISIWKTNCHLHLCSKGFFIVSFDTVKERAYVLQECPWFWGNAGLFMISWFPSFDATTMMVSKMSVWVKLHNLPLYFWLSRVFEVMANAIGKYLKIDVERVSRGIHTFARISVEVDLSQGLPDSIILIHNNTQWKKPLDYENMAFRFHGYQQTGHLLSNFPQVNKYTRRNKRKSQKPRGWQSRVNLYEAAKDEEATIPPPVPDDGPNEEVANTQGARN